MMRGSLVATGFHVHRTFKHNQKNILQKTCYITRRKRRYQHGNTNF